MKKTNPYLIIMWVIVFLLIAFNLFASTKYELKADKQVIELSQKIALSQVGVREIGYNSGAAVRSYLSSVGLNAGAAWCQAFQYWNFKQAAIFYNKPVPIKRSGNCQVVYEDVQKRGRRITYNPKVDDLLIWRFGLSRSGHVARITKLLGSGWVNTIEGNTSGYSDREGNGVYIKKRHVTNPISRMKVRGLIGFK